MALPSQGTLSSDIISLEVGASTGTTHKLAGGTTPTSDSMIYWYRAGNVNTAGVNQSAPFNYSDFYGQEARYKCTRYLAGGSTGTATVVMYPGIPTSISVPANTDKNYCTRINYDNTVAASSVSGLTIYTGSACNGLISSGNSASSSLSVYGMNGVKLYSTVNSDGSGTNISWKTANDGGSYIGTYWANPSQTLTAGRLNQVGIWSGSQTYTGTGSLSFGVSIPTTKTYFIGVGCDNYIAVYVDNVFQFAQTANITDVNNFRYWHIYPISLTAGTRTVRILGTNVGSQGSMGVELYNNTSTEISASITAAPGGTSTPSGINILDSSANYKGAGVIGPAFNNLGAECPQPTMTPTPTPTVTPGAPTATPTPTPTLTPTPTPTLTPTPTPATADLYIYAQWINSAPNASDELQYQINAGSVLSFGAPIASSNCSYFTMLSLSPGDTVYFSTVFTTALNGSTTSCPANASCVTPQITVSGGVNYFYLTTDGNVSC